MLRADPRSPSGQLEIGTLTEVVYFKGYCPICQRARKTRIFMKGSYTFQTSDGKSDEYHFLLLSCDICGLGWLDPIPENDVIARFYPSTYHTYSSRHKGQLKDMRLRIAKSAWRFTISRDREAWVRSLIASFIEFLVDKVSPSTIGVPFNLPREARILDVGCGNGWYLIKLRELGYKHLYAHDVVPVHKEYLESKGITFFGGPVEQSGLGDLNYDCIRLEHVLEHMPDPISSLRYLAKLLRPGGLIVITVPNFSSLAFRLFKDSFVHLDLPRHLFHFTPKALKLLADILGLRIIRLHGDGYWAGFAGSFSSWFLKQGRSWPGIILSHPLVSRSCRPIYTIFTVPFLKSTQLSVLLRRDDP